MRVLLILFFAILALGFLRKKIDDKFEFIHYSSNFEKKLLEKINKDIVIMHPGPINRGVELNSDVADSNNSIILDQVENGVAIRMAVMYLLSLNKV